MKENKADINGIFTYDKKIDPHVFSRVDISRENEYVKEISDVVGHEFFTHVIDKIPSHMILSVPPNAIIKLEAECFGPELSSVKLLCYTPDEIKLVTSVSILTNETGLKWNKIRKSVLAYNESRLPTFKKLHKYLSHIISKSKPVAIEYDNYIWDTYIESDKEKIYTSVLDENIVKDVTDQVNIKTCIEMIDDEIRYKITSQTYSEKYILSYVWVWFLSMYAEVKPEVVKNLTGYNSHRSSIPTTYRIQPVAITTKKGEQTTLGLTGYTLDVYDKDVFMRNLWKLTISDNIDMSNVRIGKNADPEGVENGICIEYTHNQSVENETEKIFVAKRIGRCDELPIKNMVISEARLSIILIGFYQDKLRGSGYDGSLMTTMNWPKLRFIFFNMIQMPCRFRNIIKDFEHIKFDLDKFLKLHSVFSYEDEIRLHDTYEYIMHRIECIHGYYDNKYKAVQSMMGIYHYSTESTKTSEEKLYKEVMSEFMRKGSKMTIFEALVKTCEFSIDQDKLNSELNDIINMT